MEAGLTGGASSPQISFGAVNRAILTASCENDAPKAVYVGPRNSSGAEMHQNIVANGFTATVQLANVAASCAGATSGTFVCASASSRVAPPLFYCNFEGQSTGGGSMAVGPLHAHLATDVDGFRFVVLNCTLDHAALVGIGGYGEPQDSNLRQRR